MAKRKKRPAGTLESLIRDRAAKGELTHLSIVFVAGGFAASYAPASMFGSHQVRDRDPVQALIAAIEGVSLPHTTDPWE